jgi:hypoxanthine phosphoribosyltransferase
MGLNEVTVLDKHFVEYINRKDIYDRVLYIAKAMNADYENKNPLFIAILNGSFLFAADLYRNITTASQITFVKVASYQGTSSSGKVMTLLGLDMDILDRHIIIIEDIVDTGKTMHELLPHLEMMKPASIAIATLLQKPKAIQYPIEVKYVGFSIPNDFIVGYGLDYNGYGRNLPDIYQLK